MHIFHIFLAVTFLLISSTTAFPSDVRFVIDNRTDVAVDYLWVAENPTKGKIFNWEQSGLLPGNHSDIGYPDAPACQFQIVRVWFKTRELIELHNIDLCQIDGLTVISEGNQILPRVHQIGYLGNQTGEFSTLEQRTRVHRGRAAQIQQVLQSFGFWGSMTTDCSIGSEDDGGSTSIKLPVGDFHDELSLLSGSPFNYGITGAVINGDVLRISFRDHQEIYVADISKSDGRFRIKELIVKTLPMSDRRYNDGPLIRDYEVIAYSNPPGVVGDSSWLRVGEKSREFRSCTSEISRVQKENVINDPAFIRLCKSTLDDMWLRGTNLKGTRVLYAWQLARNGHVRAGMGEQEKYYTRYGVLYTNIYVDDGSYDAYLNVCHNGPSLQGPIGEYGSDIFEETNLPDICARLKVVVPGMRQRGGNFACKE